MKSFLEITHDGTITTFAGDFDSLIKKISYIKRVSHIVPRNKYLRVLFRIIRYCVSDDSKIAEWTRAWQCEWVVIIDEDVKGVFSDRTRAIEFERKYIVQRRIK